MKGDNLDKEKAKVSVIIITLNEEENIEQCLQSIYGWTDDIHIADSNSIDNTAEIAKKYTENIHTVEEASRGHWATIRNWALSNIPLKYEWIIFVDADEWLTEELKDEIPQKIDSNPDEIGFYIYFRFIFLNRWLKHGQHRPVLRLFKHNKVRYIPDGEATRMVFEGKVGILKNDIIHQDLKPFSAWLDKHNKISSIAAKRHVETQQGKIDEAITRRPWLRKIWDQVPLLLRPFLMFFYFYFIKLGFLDGKEGLIYHLHHAFWYELLIYTKVREMEISREESKK
jgi:glycosyltransferase involved in cell wall biosynthesis